MLDLCERECFPQLEELHYIGWGDCINKSLDADICGIHEEEAEFLRSQEEDYLENVHVVPVGVGYSILNMPSECKFGITTEI